MKSLKIKITNSLDPTSYDQLPEIQEFTLKGWCVVKWHYGSCGVQFGVHSYILELLKFHGLDYPQNLNPAKRYLHNYYQNMKEYRLVVAFLLIMKPAWEAAVREVLVCELEPRNAVGR